VIASLRQTVLAAREYQELLLHRQEAERKLNIEEVVLSDVGLDLLELEEDGEEIARLICR